MKKWYLPTYELNQDENIEWRSLVLHAAAQRPAYLPRISPELEVWHQLTHANLPSEARTLVLLRHPTKVDIIMLSLDGQHDTVGAAIVCSLDRGCMAGLVSVPVTIEAVLPQKTFPDPTHKVGASLGLLHGLQIDDVLLGVDRQHKSCLT